MAELTRPETAIPPPARHGFIDKPPTKLGDPFEVIVPDFDSYRVYQIERWSSRGSTMPAQGDEVLVVLDDKGEPWVSAWWPTGGDIALQPLDADLTAIAALATESFGRSLLTSATSAAARSLIDAASTEAVEGKQPLDADLTAIAALSTSTFGRELLEVANATALRSKAEVGRDRGIVAALPASPIVGDRCAFQTSNGLWQLIYDGVGEFPWKKIGGPSLYQASTSVRELNNQTSYASLPTDPLAIKCPLAGEYDFSTHARLEPTGGAGSFGFISFAIGATVASDLWGGISQLAGATSARQNVSASSRIAATKEAEVIEKARTGGNYVVKFGPRVLRADPVKVG